ncbi:S8 family peptidase [Spirosoma sp.]|uniref:S8 family peptidase n=1 Tax=Spirosoma sp. TaxID=1899569 RepID=UPI003B3AD0EF
MSTKPTHFNLDIPNFGKVPVEVKPTQGRPHPDDITHRPPDKSNRDHDDLRLRFKNDRIELVTDPKSGMRQYAVRRQKIVTLTPLLYDRLTRDDLESNDPLSIFTRPDGLYPSIELLSLKRDRANRIIRSDCPDPEGEGAQLQYTILLDWEEAGKEHETPPFSELELRDKEGNSIVLDSQENNYLVVCDRTGDPNNPPARPPAGIVGPLNKQPSDFRPATSCDVAHYEQYSDQDNGLAVAVMDTGLKFNLLNQGEEDEWPPYTYRDADGQERRFILSYQNQSDPDCESNMADNHLGYCALLSYREQSFINAMPLLSNANPVMPCTNVNVMNSPFDDFRLFENPADKESMLAARHGTAITAIIQQNGDEAPVLPVKVFDNIGFATLFDVLNGFNYILRRCKSSKIRVVNTSWIFGQDNELVKRKIEALLKAGVLVVAAAGNEGQTQNRNLDNEPVYPACYSEDFPNVIAVTSVRKTYFKQDILAPKQDSVIGKALAKAIDFGLFNFLEGADDVIGAVLPTAGYVAVENYSKRYVNVGVVSTFGYFQNPFHKGPILRGSSYACAFVSAFVIRQLRTRPDLLALLDSGVREKIDQARQQLLKSMNGEGPDNNLEKEYLKGGYYLDGYAVD